MNGKRFLLSNIAANLQKDKMFTETVQEYLNVCVCLHRFCQKRVVRTKFDIYVLLQTTFWLVSIWFAEMLQETLTIIDLCYHCRKEWLYWGILTSRVHTRFLIGFMLLDLSFYIYVLQIVIHPFVFFLLVIVLSVLLRYTDSDYLFGIF